MSWLTAILDDSGEWLWQTTWQAGVLLALIVAVMLVLGDRLSSRWRCTLCCPACEGLG